MPNLWRDLYKDKIVSAAEAIAHIRPGDRVYIGSACGEPQELVRTLAAHGDHLADTELIHVLTLGVAPYAQPRYAHNFRANAFFIGSSVREAVNQARADYTPIFLSQVPSLFKTRRVAIDVALVMVSPPDDYGNCSLGVSVDITKAAVESAKLVIAQVNEEMPRAFGDCFLNVNQIHYLVEYHEPLLEWPGAGEVDETSRQIAQHLARLVPDGATLQLGIGRIPDAVLSMLTDKNDLGIHTEMFSDGVLKLAKRGVITGKRKTLNPGKIVGSFAAGSRELFTFMNNNPQVEMQPSDYTNHIMVISAHENMIAINSAIEVDLTGQVVADSLGQLLYSGIGGHADFIRGAALARNGKPIIAVPSTAVMPDGAVKSRIVATLQEGAGVITTRGDTHYVVTEYGVAFLHGKTMRERAMSLISIAHPDFRSELLHAAKRRRIVYPNQIMPPAQAPYPAQYEETVKLRDDVEVFIRPIRPDDEPLMREMFYDFSEQTKYLRYHAAIKAMPHNKLQVFCTVDYETEMALIALAGKPGEEQVVGVGRYMTDAEQGSAEVAFTVRDDWQRRGLGTHFFKRLVHIASEKGIQVFHAYVLVENSGMLKIFHRSGLVVESMNEGDVVRVTMRLPAVAGPAAKRR
ncbi:MAG: GNAT family N-acetyltransferase [Planctomycetota bacterium]